MKKILFLIAILLCCVMTIFAQNNDRISYQAVVRDTENKLVANKLVNVTVTITDADNHSYTQEFTDVQTNFNGMLSLIIGPDGENAAWNSIHWNHANVVTTITLAGVELGTLAMPLTAVPYAMYAEYADELDPGATVVTNIYNKMRSDSLALGALIDANAANIGELQEMDEALSARIAADSNNLVIFKAKVKTDSTTLRNLINTNADNITITNTNLTALQNRVNTFNTNVCDSVDACVKRIVSDTASALRGLIENTDDKFDNYYTKTQTDINIHDTANTVREEMNAQLATKADADNVYTKAEVDALLAQLVQSLPKMDQETFTVASDGQTTFTLNHAPKSDYIYRMYINGVMVGGSNTQVLTISSTATKTMQYDASKNGNKTLKANDKVTIVYWY